MLKFQAFLTLSMALSAISGCASVDPWDTTDRAPSAYYRSTPDTSLGLSSKPLAGKSGAAPTMPARGTRLTLADCIRTALEQNPMSRSSWLATRSAAARVGERRAAYLPAAQLTSEIVRGKSVSLDSDKEGRTRNTYAGGVDVSLLLFDGGLRLAGVKGAEAELLATNFRHNATLQDIALAVAEAYYEFLGAQWLVKVAEETVKQTKYHVEVARARHGSGLVTRSDVLRAETQRASAELSLVRSRNSIQVAHGRLARAMGLRVSQTFEVAELPEDAHRAELPNVDRLLVEAARSRPELAAALARIEAKRAEIKAARAGYWPTITANASAGRKDTGFLPDREEWSAGVALSFPLFTGFERSYQLRRARSELARAAAEHSDLVRGIELEVWTAYWQVIEAGEAIVAARELVASAEESARVAEGEYKSGVNSVIGVIDAQAARTVAKRRFVQARLDWYTAKARFERAVGRMFTQESTASVFRKVGY
jgi:outer membrane protein